MFDKQHFATIVCINGDFMNNKPIDKRIRKTKKSIRNALAKLMTEKDINSITIKDIAETADINRKTFYNYYSSVNQVIDEIENNVVDSVRKAMLDVDYEEAMKKPYIIFERLTETINTDFEFYSHLLSYNSNYNLTSKIVEMLKENAKAAIKKDLHLAEPEIDIMLDFALSGMVNIYQKWFNAAYMQTLEEVSKTVSVLCFGGMNDMLRKYIRYR